MVLTRMGRQSEAVPCFRKVVDLDTKSAEAHLNLGIALADQFDLLGALAEFSEAVRLAPDAYAPHYNKGRVLVDLRRNEEAKRLQARFETLQRNQHITDRAQTLGNFALASAAACDWPQAIAQLKEGLQLCGDCSALPLLRKDLGLIYCRSGDLKNGLAELLEAQKLAPNDADIEQAIRMIQSPRETRSHGSQR